jgi:hypothetical protein
MRFTFRSRSDNFHSVSREMSKSYFLPIDASATSGKELLSMKAAQPRATIVVILLQTPLGIFCFCNHH